MRAEVAGMDRTCSAEGVSEFDLFVDNVFVVCHFEKCCGSFVMGWNHCVCPSVLFRNRLRALLGTSEMMAVCFGEPSALNHP